MAPDEVAQPGTEETAALDRLADPGRGLAVQVGHSQQRGDPWCGDAARLVERVEVSLHGDLHVRGRDPRCLVHQGRSL